MSLSKKIALSFFISVFIIAILVVLESTNLIEIKNEIRALELSDTIRSKSLQLRRHEKNFFLYRDEKELAGVHTYLMDLKSILRENASLNNNLRRLDELADSYEKRFKNIETILAEFEDEFHRLKSRRADYAIFFPLIESTTLEQPLADAELLMRAFSLAPDHPSVQRLRILNVEITELRKAGEEILTVSKDLDKAARDNVEATIGHLQRAALVLFFLFLVVGLGALFIISRSVANRLKILTSAIERTGKGNFLSLPAPDMHDEVGALITAFNHMENDLAAREEELKKKNEELLQSRKLASIGTLASGVAHELNNPLNNIYLSAQVLQKDAGPECSAFMKETLDDIIGQSVRVKRIVGDLLEYARGKEPQFSEVELNDLIRGAFRLLKATVNVENINFALNSNREKITVNADREQLERVFINLFSNAVEAMSGKGDIIVTLKAVDESVRIWVSDTGKGISHEDLEKVFEPFFTTKDKGTGLGLAIVFSIIKKHKGEVMVDSEKEKGTTFYINLPWRSNN